MNLDADTCYRAMLARDARYDGRFFTCVRTTRIYCRPICPAQPPRIENCQFVATAAAARQAGYRPCLRCRPESSPGIGAWNGTSALVTRAVRLIEGGALDDGNVEHLAERLGVGGRQLRRLFRKHLGASPVTLAQTRRVHLAKQLIHETSLPMTEVALASGYGSIRRFNESFRAMFGREPRELRKRSGTARSDGTVSLLLAYRPPYDWDAMLAFLAQRAIPGVEAVADGIYSRTIEIDGAAGFIQVSHEPRAGSLRADVSLPHVKALPGIVNRIRRLFDLGADTSSIGETLSRDAALSPLVSRRPGLRLPGAWDGFEIGVRAILGQQVSVKAAARLAGRLVMTFGRSLEPGPERVGLTHVFPPPERLAAADVATIGMPAQRGAAIRELAVAATRNPRLFEPYADLNTAIEILTRLPGVGVWTANYIAMRAMAENDAFLADDVALQRILCLGTGRPAAQALLKRAEPWRPWRAYAVVHFWTAEAQGLAEQRKEWPPARERRPARATSSQSGATG